MPYSPETSRCACARGYVSAGVGAASVLTLHTSTIVGTRYLFSRRQNELVHQVGEGEEHERVEEQVDRLLMDTHQVLNWRLMAVRR